MKPFGCIITSTPSSSAFFQNGAKAGSDNSLPATLVRISTPVKPSSFDAALQLLGRLVAVGHRHRAEALEAVRLAGAVRGNAVVDDLRRLDRDVERHRVIALRRRRRDHLHVDAHGVEIGKPVLVAGAFANIGFLLLVERLGLGVGEMRQRNGRPVEMRLDEFRRLRHRRHGNGCRW